MSRTQRTPSGKGAGKSSGNDPSDFNRETALTSNGSASAQRPFSDGCRASAWQQKEEGFAQTTQSAAANLLRQKTTHLRRVAEKQTTASGLEQFEKKVEPVFWQFFCATLLRRKKWQRASNRQSGQLFGEKKDAVLDGNLFLKSACGQRPASLQSP